MLIIKNCSQFKKKQQLQTNIVSVLFWTILNIRNRIHCEIPISLLFLKLPYFAIVIHFFFKNTHKTANSKGIEWAYLISFCLFLAAKMLTSMTRVRPESLTTQALVLPWYSDYMCNKQMCIQCKSNVYNILINKKAKN